MALTFTVVEVQPHRQRWKANNATGGATSDVITQAMITGAAGAVAGQPMFDFFSQAFVNLAGWTAAAFEGPSILPRITPLQANAAWGLRPDFGAGVGRFLVDSSANGDAYIDVEFDYAALVWPPT